MKCRVIVLAGGMAAAWLVVTGAAAQSGIGYDQGGPYEGIFADHRASGDNGAKRLDHRLGGDGSRASTPSKLSTPPPPSTGSFVVHSYRPTPLNDIAIAEKQKAAAKRKAEAPH